MRYPYKGRESTSFNQPTIPSGAVGNADRMNQRRVRVWHSSGRVRRKTAPTGTGNVSAKKGYTMIGRSLLQVCQCTQA